jgi:hypothetical protein
LRIVGGHGFFARRLAFCAPLCLYRNDVVQLIHGLLALLSVSILARGVPVFLLRENFREIVFVREGERCQMGRLWEAGGPLWEGEWCIFVS